MAYFLAPSLVSLRNEINAAHPNRDKASDGWVGDTAHAARKSDHNPDYSAGGIVRALDVDKDGIDTGRLLQVAIANPSTEYVIWQGGIYTRSNGFRRAAYNGSNPHNAHMHISIRHTATAAAAKGWGYSGGGAPAPAPAPGGGISFEDVVRGVIAGRYGTGPARAAAVTAAGHNYEAVRAEVNRRLGGGAPAPAPAPARKSNEQIAAEVRAGQWGNGDDRKRRLAAAGYDYNAIQAIINGGGAPAPAPAGRKSNEQIAAEVRAGHWGNNPQRSQRLSAAGYNPSEIQAIINGGGGGAPAAVRLSISQLASQVIAGQWGNGTERQRRITAAGYDYNAVRAEVNRRL